MLTIMGSSSASSRASAPPSRWAEVRSGVAVTLGAGLGLQLDRLHAVQAAQLGHRGGQPDHEGPGEHDADHVPGHGDRRQAFRFQHVEERPPEPEPEEADAELLELLDDFCAACPDVGWP